MEVSDLLHFPAGLTLGAKSPQYPLDRRLDGRYRQSARGGEDKTTLSMLGIEPLPSSP
jgi:hypothetical protein